MMEETLRRVDDLLSRALAVGDRLFRGGKLSDATRERQAIFDERQTLLADWIAAYVRLASMLKAAGSQLTLPDSTAIEGWLFDCAWTEAKGDERERRFAEWAGRYRDLAAPLLAVGKIASPLADERERESGADFIFRRDGGSLRRQLRRGRRDVPVLRGRRLADGINLVARGATV